MGRWFVAAVAVVSLVGFEAAAEINHGGIGTYNPYQSQRPTFSPNPLLTPNNAIPSYYRSNVGFGQPGFNGGVGNTLANSGYGAQGLGMQSPYMGYGLGTLPYTSYYPYASYWGTGGLGYGYGSSYLTQQSLIDPNWYWNTTGNLGGSLYGLGNYWDPYLYGMNQGWDPFYSNTGYWGGTYDPYGYGYGLGGLGYGYGSGFGDYGYGYGSGYYGGLGGYGYGGNDGWGFGFGLGDLGGYGYDGDNGWGFGFGDLGYGYGDSYYGYY